MLEKYPSERVVFYIDCTALLGAGETISATPDITSYPQFTGGASLTFESATVNTNSVTLPNGATVAAGKLISVIIGGGQSATDKEQRLYSVVTTFNTSAGNTITSKSVLAVLPLGPLA